MNRSYMTATSGFVEAEDIDHPLALYAQPKHISVGYDYWKDEVNSFFVEYPEASKVTGMSLSDIYEMTPPEFKELKKIVEAHYKMCEENPDVHTRQLVEFRELARSIIEGLINANLIQPRKRQV